MIKAPVWKDTAYAIQAVGGTLDTLTYHIDVVNDNPSMEDETIFQGKAFPAPRATNMSVNINRICENYLSNELPTSGRNITLGRIENKEAYKEFKLYNEYNVLLNNYRFLYNWEYDFDVDFTQDINLSRVINGHRADGMLLMTSYWESATESVWNTVDTDYEAVIWEDDPIYPISACGQYALYYLNRAGGWDSFLIEGLVRKKDSYEKYYTNSTFSNNTLDFEKKAYHNQITTAYELHTGYLDDKESERLAYHLLVSNRVYLHNLCSGEIMPVILTDAETSYKTFKSEGRKMATYTINVEESQLKQNI